MLAQRKEDLELGLLEERGQKKAKSPETIAASKKKRVGVFLGRLLQLPRPVVPTVACVLLLPLQAVDASARDVPVASADVLP